MINDIDQIIIKVLSSEASSEERALLNNWLNSDTAHFTEFVKLKSYWASQVKLNHQTSADAAFHRFKNKHLTTKTKSDGKMYNFLIGLTSVAAVIMLFIMIMNKATVTPVENISYSTQNEKATLLLPDSSTVILNKYSKLYYTSDYNKTERHLKLVGEAYFDVRKNPKSPFIVELTKSRITVLGTAFNVRAYDKDNVIKTTLVRGSIRFNMDDDQVTLKPNQVLNFNKQNDEINIKSVSIESSMLWLKDVYRFQSTTLQFMLNELGAIYEKQMLIPDNKLANTVISGSFQKNQSLDEILSIISRSIPIKWNIHDEKVLISDKK